MLGGDALSRAVSSRSASSRDMSASSRELRVSPNPRLKPSDALGRSLSSSIEDRSRNTEDRSRNIATEVARDRTRKPSDGDSLSVVAAMSVNSLFNDDERKFKSPDIDDSVVLNAILSQAILDTKGFMILLPEKYNEQKKRLSQITGYLDTLQAKLSLEYKSKNELKATEISKEVCIVYNDLVQAERAVLKHLCGSLRWYHHYNNRKANEIAFTSNDATLRSKKPDSEVRIRELDSQIQSMKSTISRLESVKGNDRTNISLLELNRVKLDYASTKSELKDTSEELAAAKTTLANLSRQTPEPDQITERRTRDLTSPIPRRVERRRAPSSPSDLDHPRRTRPSAQPDGNTDLADLQGRVEDRLNIPRVGFSMARFTTHVNTLIQESLNVAGKLAVAEREQAFLQDSINNLESLSRDGKVSKRDNGAGMELAETLKKLADSERSASRVPEMQSIIDEQSERIRKFGVQREQDLKTNVDRIDTGRADARGELTKVKENFEGEIERIQDGHAKLFAEYKERLDLEKRDVLTNRDRDMEACKAEWETEANATFEQRIAVLKLQHESKIVDVTAMAELENTQFKGSFQRDQIESRSRLEQAEQALVDSKQAAFVEREKFQEKIDRIEHEAENVETQNKRLVDDWNVRKAEFQKKLDLLHDENDGAKDAVKDVNRKLEIKSRELNEVHEVYELDMKRLLLEHESKVTAFKATIDDLETLVASLQKAADEFKEKSAGYEAEAERQSVEIGETKLKASSDVEAAQESLHEATDQLERSQRLLRDVSGDVDRFRLLADERDTEVLALKRKVIEYAYFSFGRRRRRLWRVR